MTPSITTLYQAAQDDRLGFWDAQAKTLVWDTPWHTVLDWQKPHAKWFVGGRLNASVNCLDRHLGTPTANKNALIWEGEDGSVQTYSYARLAEEVNRFAHVLTTTFHVKKGDRVTIYMPLIPQLVVAVLACARIGAIHSVVFGGFSALSLRDRIEDCGSKLVITADGGRRRGQVVPLKSIVDEALSTIDTVQDVIVVSHLGIEVPLQSGRDVLYEPLMAKASPYCPPQSMDSEDPLFILYTSGTTGKPKGIVHTTGGYLTHAAFSTKLVFDLQPEDIYWCTADIGWITGHTYVVYGPLANGATVFLYEGSPDYPDKDRFWKLIDTHKVSIFYTAPTAIRACMKWGDHHPNAHDLSSLRLLGSVGEPINPEAWRWYHKVIGNSRCPIVDTWWQTETGGIMITTLPGYHRMKPGYAGLPLPGIEAKIVGEDGSEVVVGKGLLTLNEPWPSMLRGIWGDPRRYEEVYWSTLPTYFAGDGASKDQDGHVMIEGRVDDVLNVAGHRIGTMEVESALVDYNGVAEAAVVGVPDDIKGQAIVAFITLKEGVVFAEDGATLLKNWVASRIGAIARPTWIILTPELPKTRSGKIMRRVLKNSAQGLPAGDVSTLANPDIVELLRAQISATMNRL